MDDDLDRKPKDVQDGQVFMALNYNWPLVPFPLPSPLRSIPRVQGDEEEMERIVGQVVEDLIRTASANSQEHSHKVCQDILLDSLGLMCANTDVMENDVKDENTSPLPQEDCRKVDKESGKLCQEVIMSLVTEAVRDPKLICKDILSEFVESILPEKSNQTSNKTPTAHEIRNELPSL